MIVGPPNNVGAERTYSQSDFDRELALRVGIALETAEKCCFSNTLRTGKYIAADIAKIPRDASLVERHDAGIREQESKRVMALADAYYLEMSARKQNEHEEQLALREAAWREAATKHALIYDGEGMWSCACGQDMPVTSVKRLAIWADHIRALPSSTELLAQREKE